MTADNENSTDGKTTREIRIFLLDRARDTISNHLKGIKEKIDHTDDLKKESFVHEKQGCFVTLHKGGNLRGCIGTIEPVRSLLENVEENAVNAAFQDPRFPPLKPEELDQVEIEISVLTRPEKLEFSDYNDLISKLKSGVHGVILSKGWHRSTFLPQVWDQLPDPVTFLEHLCRKGGMAADCWKEGDIQVEVYEVEHFSE